MSAGPTVPIHEFPIAEIWNEHLKAEKETEKETEVSLWKTLVVTLRNKQKKKYDTKEKIVVATNDNNQFCAKLAIRNLTGEMDQLEGTVNEWVKKIVDVEPAYIDPKYVGWDKHNNK